MQGAKENPLRSLLVVNEEGIYRNATPQTPTMWFFESKERCEKAIE